MKIKAEAGNVPNLTATAYTTTKGIGINEKCISGNLVQSESVFDVDGKRSSYGGKNLGKVFTHYYAVPKNIKDVTMREIDGKTTTTLPKP